MLSISGAAIEYSESSWGRLVCEWPKIGNAGGELTLRRPLYFTVSLDTLPIYFRIPAGFTTDLASDPLDRRGRWDYASVVHDWLYENKGHVNPIMGREFDFTRKECDKIFYYIMEQANPPKGIRNKYYKVKNKITYGVVRMFGGKTWRT